MALRGMKWSRDPMRSRDPKGTVGYPSDSLTSWLLPTTDIFRDKTDVSIAIM